MRLVICIPENKNSETAPWDCLCQINRNFYYKRVIHHDTIDVCSPSTKSCLFVHKQMNPQFSLAFLHVLGFSKPAVSCSYENAVEMRKPRPSCRIVLVARFSSGRLYSRLNPPPDESYKQRNLETARWLVPSSSKPNCVHHPIQLQAAEKVPESSQT